MMANLEMARGPYIGIADGMSGACVYTLPGTLDGALGTMAPTGCLGMSLGLQHISYLIKH